MISDSVPVQTPEPEPASSPPSITPTQRPRWLLPGAAAVVVLAAAIGLVAGLVLTNRNAGAGGAASYVPADSAIYYELRLDLPGDQRAALKSFLGHFPLLQVDKYLTDQLDQQLDELTKTMPSPAYRYSTDVKPWFDGRVGFALVRYPSMLPGTSNPVPDVLVLVGVMAASRSGQRLPPRLIRPPARPRTSPGRSPRTSSSGEPVPTWWARLSTATPALRRAWAHGMSSRPP
ncbi:MAG: hypothetical protein E6I62_08985 [Chloroflexi bacterium]|nr:MAG: hypothetical protein E6I62_08985 [Chloroflexota bacterium]